MKTFKSETEAIAVQSARPIAAAKPLERPDSLLVIREIPFRDGQYLIQRCVLQGREPTALGPFCNLGKVTCKVLVHLFCNGLKDGFKIFLRKDLVIGMCNHESNLVRVPLQSAFFGLEEESPRALLEHFA